MGQIEERAQVFVELGRVRKLDDENALEALQEGFELVLREGIEDLRDEGGDLLAARVRAPHGLADHALRRAPAEDAEFGVLGAVAPVERVGVADGAELAVALRVHPLVEKVERGGPAPPRGLE